MIEVIKHLLGGCGELHLNIFHLIPVLLTPIYILKHNIKWCWNKGCSTCLKLISKVKSND